MNNETIVKALRALLRNPSFNLKGSDIANIEWHDERLRPTDAEIQAKITELEGGQT